MRYSNCPLAEFMYDDLLSSSLGESKCMAREKERILDLRGGLQFDWHACDSDDYNSCKYFLEKKNG